MRQYSYHFSCKKDGEEAKVYELMNSDVRFSYVRGISYTDANSSKLCSLILESMTIESDETLKDVFRYFNTLNGGILTCEQFGTDGKKTFVIESEILAANLTINSGFGMESPNERGFSLTLKLDFREV